MVPVRAAQSVCPFVFPSSKPFKWETGGTGAFTLSLFGKQTYLSATSKKCGVMDCLLFGLGCYSVIIVVVAVAQQLKVRKQQRNRKTSFLFENEQWKWLQQSPRKNHVVNKTLIARGSLAFWDSLHKFKQTGTQGAVHVSLLTMSRTSKSSFLLPKPRHGRKVDTQSSQNHDLFFLNTWSVWCQTANSGWIIMQ